MSYLFFPLDYELLLAFAIPFIMSVTIHEYSHGLAAYLLGDDTAKSEGRLTLNPIVHIDVWGLLFLLVTQLFGWAKPVPVNFSRIRHKYGMAIVSFAGPLSNLLLALLSVFFLSVFIKYVNSAEVDTASRAANIFTFIFTSLQASVIINIVLFTFNLFPILPLDGGRIVANFLPRELALKFAATERYGFFVIIAILILNLQFGFISKIVGTVLMIVGNIFL